MHSAPLLWALLASFAVKTWAQEDDYEYEEDQECSCSGLDYTNGGSYLIDGNSDSQFTFTSVFEGTSSNTNSTGVISLTESLDRVML